MRRALVAVLCATAAISTVRLAAVPAAQANSGALASRDRVRVPFTGCASDGQTGPLDAPRAGDVEVWLDARTAARLSVYEPAPGPAVLAPRGWSCFGAYGSGGHSVIVTPSPIDSSNPLAAASGIAGFGVRASVVYGDTSGRFEVAEIVAHVFPAHKSFVDKIVAEGIMPAGHFTAGVFPADRLTYRSDRVLDYETPAHAQGLGTYFQFAPDGDQIRGVVMLTPQSNVWHVSLRLPPDLRDLSDVLIQQFEMQNARAE